VSFVPFFVRRFGRKKNLGFVDFYPPLKKNYETKIFYLTALLFISSLIISCDDEQNKECEYIGYVTSVFTDWNC
jgi:hypothetical protein